MQISIFGALAIACCALCYACGGDDDGNNDSGGGSGSSNNGGSSAHDDAATCKATCPAVIAAACDLAPESVDACEQQCDAFLAVSACRTPWAELQACGQDRDIGCTSGTPSLPAPVGCEVHQQQFVACYASHS